MSAFSIMGERIDRLKDAARQGNIGEFYCLIGEDAKLLEEIDKLPFVETPLHVAALAAASSGCPQHIQFAMEMMRLKPSFARKPDLNGDSPIHLALKGKHTQMVHRLLQVDGDLVRVKGFMGRTPLHDVAAKASTEQQLDLLFKFLSDCPNSIEDVTIRNQTALHIALENNCVDAFKRLVRWLRKNKSENAREILNWQDEEGNTVLHVAVSRNQTEAKRVLLNCVVNLNIQNFDGRTAQDMLQEQTQENNSEIRDMLSYDGALSCFCLPKLITCPENYRRKLGVLFDGGSKMFRKTVLFFEGSGIFREIIIVFERIRIFRKKIVEWSRISNDDRNALLVVAALLITITYQVLLSPPGGLVQDDKSVEQTSPDGNDVYDVFEHAGTAIAQTYMDEFATVLALNYITFTLSVMLTFLLLPSGYISVLFKMALVHLWVSYYFSMGVIVTDSLQVWSYCLISTGICFALVLLAFFGRQFFGVGIKFLKLHWIFYIAYACTVWWIVICGSPNIF